MRKNILRLGEIVEETVYKTGFNEEILPKKEWGYAVKAIVNGWCISCAETSWYEAYKGLLEEAKYITTKEKGHYIKENERQTD